MNILLSRSHWSPLPGLLELLPLPPPSRVAVGRVNERLCCSKSWWFSRCLYANQQLFRAIIVVGEVAYISVRSTLIPHRSVASSRTVYCLDARMQITINLVSHLRGEWTYYLLAWMLKWTPCLTESHANCEFRACFEVWSGPGGELSGEHFQRWRLKLWRFELGNKRLHRLTQSLSLLSILLVAVYQMSGFWGRLWCSFQCMAMLQKYLICEKLIRVAALEETIEHCRSALIASF